MNKSTFDRRKQKHLPQERPDSTRVKSNSGFSLAELIVAIALLAFFGVFAARLFFVSNQLSETTRQLDLAVLLGANIAETWQAAALDEKEDFSPTRDLTAGLILDNSTDGFNQGWFTYLDKKLLACDDDKASFLLRIEPVESDYATVETINIKIFNLAKDKSMIEQADNIFYELTVSRYSQEGGK